MWCKWCGQEIPRVIDGKTSGQRMWHPPCYREYELHTRQAVQFDYLVERDGACCALCPPDTPAPSRWKISPYPVRLCWQSYWSVERFGSPDKYWPAPTKPWREQDEIERATGEVWDIERVVALEVDHQVPLWHVADLPDDERRWYFGPGNLWLLCPSHHREKTRAEAALRAAARRSGQPQVGQGFGGGGRRS